MSHSNANATSSNQRTTMIHSANMPEFSTSDNWNLWQERLELHFVEISCSTEQQKISTLLKTIGSEAYGILHSICSPDLPSSKSYSDLCDILQRHFMPPVIIFRERKNFYAAKKSDSETIAAWFARVKKLSLQCKFGTALENIVLDKFIVELPQKIFERLCEETENLSLNDAFRKALIFESKFSVQSTIPSEVNFVQQRGNKYNNKKQKNYGTSKSNNNNNNDKKRTPCGHCGWKNHNSNECRFRNSICHTCNKKGHLASVCNSSKTKKDKNSCNFVSNNIDYNFVPNNDNFNDNFLNSIYSITEESESSMFGSNSSCFSITHRNGLPFELTVDVNGIQMKTLCDTGAPCSLMSIETFNKYFHRNLLSECSTPFTGYGGELLNIVGEFNATICYGEKKILGRIIVTNTTRPTLLGRDSLQGLDFKLVQCDNSINSVDVSLTSACNEIINQLKSEFFEVFKNELGKCNVVTVNLPLCDRATPIFCKPRAVPLAWRNAIAKQLDDLVQNGVLIPIDNSDWGTPLVPVVKPNGQIRICGDYKTTINRFLIDVKYPLPRIDQIFASMQGGELFTKLDLSNAYNQLILDKESQKLCAWSTHKGIFLMTRMPFGIKTAASIFQKTMEGLLGEFNSTFCYQDDIVVTGKNFSEHTKTLRGVLSKLLSAGLRLNLKKCEFFKNKISYLGFDIDRNGLSKNQERIKSILNAPAPTNISELRAINGMANHHSKFIPDFSKIMTPIYKLLQKDVAFNWDRECQMAFNKIKSEICSDRVLVHFDPKIPLILTTDACKSAVAGVLSHVFTDGTRKPISFVSRALNKAELNYSTIEKEALAIIFSVTKLKQYLIGTFFTLETDHRPLLALFGENKGIPVMAAARMQRWALTLSGFNYSIKYVKGRDNTADELSRIPQAETEEIKNEANYINYITTIGFVGPMQIDYKMIAIETRRDSILSKVMDSVQNGTTNEMEGKQFEPFRTRSSELSVESGCVLWGYRTIIPTKLRTLILEELHHTHQGIVKTKSLARSFVWWPNIDREIEILIKACDSCQKTHPNPEKSSLIPWTPTDSAWKRIHVDFAGPVKNYYLFIIIDSFSKWVEVFKTKDITANFTINKMRETFCRYGLVNILVSDNGRQFTSAEFQHFLKSNGIKHILTAPGHPATNGQAENFVKTLKKSLYASLNNGKEHNFDVILNKFLFDYRITKHCITNESPAKLLFGRELKSRFSLLKPPLTTEVIKGSQQNSIETYKGKRNKNFNVGEEVFIRDYRDPNKQSWSPAVIKKKLGPRNYSCWLTNEERDIKRHLNQIRDRRSSDSVAEHSQDTGNFELNASMHNVQAPITETDGARQLEDDVVESTEGGQNINDSIPDVIERPPQRAAASRAKDLINNLF